MRNPNDYFFQTSERGRATRGEERERAAVRAARRGDAGSGRGSPHCFLTPRTLRPRQRTGYVGFPLALSGTALLKVKARSRRGSLCGAAAAQRSGGLAAPAPQKIFPRLKLYGAVGLEVGERTEPRQHFRRYPPGGPRPTRCNGQHPPYAPPSLRTAAEPSHALPPLTPAV